jgi:hypothetical protein
LLRLHGDAVGVAETDLVDEDLREGDLAEVDLSEDVLA